MSPLDFRCAVNETGGFCLNGATCIEKADDVGAFVQCACPSGTMHDFTMTHSQNCGVKSVELLGTFVVLTVEYACTVLFLVWCIITKARARVKAVLTAQLVYVVLLWAGILCIFVQGGTFLPAVLMMNLSQVVLTHLAFEITGIAMASVLGTIERTKAMRFRLIVLVLHSSSIIEQIVVAIPVLVVVSRADFTVNPYAFNLTYIISCSLQAFGAMITFAILGRGYKQLGDSFRKNTGNSGVLLTAEQKEKQDDILSRIDGQVKYAQACIYNFAGVLILPILFLSMGSIPYQIWIWFSLMVIIPMHIFFEVRQMLGKKLHSGSSSSGSKEAIVIGTASRVGDESVRISRIMNSSKVQGGLTSHDSEVEHHHA